jgi:hypothetical protein
MKRIVRSGIMVGCAAALAVAAPVMLASQAPAKRPAAAAAATAAKPKPAGTLAEIMRGIYFPSSNLIFDVQQNDPGAARKKSDTGDSTTDKFTNLYPGWLVVENAAVALTDGVDLLLTPGRLCENGKPVPVDRADYRKFAADMRAAGLATLKAARTKNQEKVSDATNDLTDACSGCHQVYRRGPAEGAARCTAP